MFLYLSGFTKLKEIPQSRLATRKYKELNLRKRINLKYTLKISVKDLAKKTHALTRIQPYRTLLKNDIDLNLFFNSQFDCYLSVSMCHPRTIHNKDTQLHEASFCVT